MLWDTASATSAGKSSIPVATRATAGGKVTAALTGGNVGQITIGDLVKTTIRESDNAAKLTRIMLELAGYYRGMGCTVTGSAKSGYRVYNHGVYILGIERG